MQENIKLEVKDNILDYGENQMLYRHIMKLPIPICKQVVQMHSSELDVGQKEDKTIDRMHNLDKLISGNLCRLVPNSSNSLLNTSLNELCSYVKLCKSYGESINRMFQEKCNEELRKLEEFKKVKILRNKFKIEKVNELPCEIVSEIYQYLPYEERTNDILLKHKNWSKAMLSKYTAEELKKIYEKVHNEHFVFYFDKEVKRLGLQMYDVNQYINLPYWMQRKRGVYRKSDVTAYINSFIEKYKSMRNPITRKDERIYNFLLGKYYKLLKTIIYIVNCEKKKKKRKVTRVSKKTIISSSDE